MFCELLHLLFTCPVVLQEVDIEKELGVELGLGHDDDDEAEEDKHEGVHAA
jgi:hypothetical protein